jgi:hypothetical protein
LAVTPRLKPYAFLIDPMLARALKRLKRRDGIPEGEAIRRALAKFLTSEGIMPTKRRQPAKARSATKR